MQFVPLMTEDGAPTTGAGPTADHRTEAHSVVGGRTLPALLRDGAARHPDRPLLVFEDDGGQVHTFSWQRMVTGAAAVAEYLRQLGVRPGQRVLVHLPNRPEFLFTWFAIAELGATMVPVNVLSSRAELEYLVDHSGAVAVLTDAAGAETVRETIAHRALPVVVCEEARLLELPAREPRPQEASPGADLAVLYTSGTTSRPKGVRVTHANYIYAGEVYAAAMRLTPDDRLLTVLPLFHANAQYYSVMGALVSGATIVLMPRFSASRWLAQAARHRATVSNLFAAPIRMILAKGSLPRIGEHSLRAVMFAQNLTQAEVRQWNQVVGAPLVQGYGMTETIGPPLMNPVVGYRRENAVGRPTLGYRCRLVGPDGNPVAEGEAGELLVAGEPGVSLMAGYLDDPDATATVLRDGWLRTGDVMRVDSDGLFTYIDRSKDMIKRGGENVAASEVEAVLRDHPQVQDAAVVGVPDPMLDEQIIAFVVLDGTTDRATAADQLIGWCQNRLAKYRVPSDVCVVAELPRTSVGKIQKHVLRADWLASHT